MMATAAIQIGSNRVIRPKRQGRQLVRYETRGGKELPAEEGRAISLQQSRVMESRGLQRRIERQMAREKGPEDRPSIALRRLAVEAKIVEVLWTESRLPAPRGNAASTRHGIRYIDERNDLYANAIDNGGWLTVPPRAPPPTAREIDEHGADDGPLVWLRWLDREEAKFVTVVAGQKRGDVARNISWARVKKAMPRLTGLEPYTLDRRYKAALRHIVAMLDFAKIKA